MWIWPSYHQWLINTSISQPSGDTNLTQPLNQVGFHIWHDLKSPYMTEYENYYIICLYMTFTSNDIHDIYNKDQRPKQDHDNCQQLSYIIYDLHHKHLSIAWRTTTYIIPSLVHNISQNSFNIINLCLRISHIDINSSSWSYQGQLAIFP